MVRTARLPGEAADTARSSNGLISGVGLLLLPGLFLLIVFAVWTVQVIGAREVASHQRDQCTHWLRELQRVENTFQHNTPESPELVPAFERLSGLVAELTAHSDLAGQARTLGVAGAHLQTVLDDPVSRTEARQGVLRAVARVQVLIWREHGVLTAELQRDWNRILAVASAALAGMASALGLLALARRRRLEAEALGRRLESALVDAQEAKVAAEAASHAKSHFLATVSHEIRTPMTAILGTVEMMGAGTLTPRMQDQVGVIGSSSRSLLRLIDDILDLSRIEAGQLDVARSPFAIEPVVDDVIALFNATAKARRKTLVPAVGDGVPAAVLGDARRLRQVLSNLVGNALKFSGGGLVTVGVEPDPDGLRFTVADNGPGLAPVHQERVLEAFTQVDASSTRLQGGVGLGLAICHQLVQAMGGRIGVESEAGCGAILWFVLPLHAAPLPPAMPASSGTSPTRLPRALSVMVVDDNRLNRMILGELLDALGCRATLVGTATDALSLVDSQAWDAILMDCDMPGMDGLQATRAVRGLSTAKATLSIVGVSGHVGPQASVAALEAGMDAYLHKPVGLLELRQVLERLCPAATSVAQPGGSG